MWITIKGKAINLAHASRIQWECREIEIYTDRCYSFFFETPKEAETYYLQLTAELKAQPCPFEIVPYK